MDWAVVLNVFILIMISNEDHVSPIYMSGPPSEGLGPQWGRNPSLGVTRRGENRGRPVQ